jgi:hypothetical protein
MGRITQPKESKGSLKWIQVVVNDNPVLLDDLIGRAGGYKKVFDIKKSQ